MREKFSHHQKKLQLPFNDPFKKYLGAEIFYVFFPTLIRCCVQSVCGTDWIWWCSNYYAIWGFTGIWSVFTVFFAVEWKNQNKLLRRSYKQHFISLSLLNVFFFLSNSYFHSLTMCYAYENINHFPKWQYQPQSFLLVHSIFVVVVGSFFSFFGRWISMNCMKLSIDNTHAQRTPKSSSAYISYTVVTVIMF